jgi:hypothetical protein
VEPAGRQAGRQQYYYLSYELREEVKNGFGKNF